MSASTTGPPVDIPKTFGALLLGALFASVLSGISDLQAMFYFKAYREDPLRLKLMVAVVWILDTIHTGLIWSAVWFYLIGSYGQFLSVDEVPWQIPMIVILTPTIGVFKDCFFAYRIFILSGRNRVITAPIILLVCLRVAVATTAAARLFKFGRYSLLQLHGGWLITFTLIVSAVLDALSSGLLVFFLLRHRVEHGRLKHVLDKLMLYGVESGTLTFFGSISVMLCWILLSHTLIFVGLYFCMAKFYTNVLLAALNSRNHIRQRRQTTTSIGLERRTGRGRTYDSEAPVQFATPNSASTKVPSDHFQLGVQMERGVHYHDVEAQTDLPKSTNWN
ncbi:hypothetical protein FB45DRAFT_83459 [Roridomyces roridus]|uniref:DUF6534 domain-containing protein n=1 Tax=Roridomyces roridus TaxID=1738132 RepID=A0AAD7BLF5_9AGAR|nr:hypothetical protein FB45DRAFT_83459 [Roridomyces roridus]